MLKKLIKDSRIKVLAPAFPPDPQKTQNGIHYLENKGFSVISGGSLSGNHGYFSASDDQRVEEINSAFVDPEIDAVFCARGGWGTLRFLDKLNYNGIKENPKVLVGYSDITFIQLAIWEKCRIPSISGPMVAVEMGDEILDFTAKYFWEQIENTDPDYAIDLNVKEIEYWKKGNTHGTLLGGCLSMIAHLLGTPYFPDFTDSILFIEDVGEEVYKIDRYLAQLQQAGIFNKIKGLIIGQFIDCPEGRSPSFSISDILHHYFDGLNVPVINNFPYGHGMRKISMPIGAKTTIDSSSNKLVFENLFYTK
ncbi:MAG: LD-carboxypeptidase [Calditrichaeota bacterium]|nr:LD-carboxypeptidase [Calditrichota bacterium]